MPSTPVGPDSTTTAHPDSTREVAARNWVYAVMAADVYRTRGRMTKDEADLKAFESSAKRPAGTPSFSEPIDCSSASRQEEALDDLTMEIEQKWTRETTMWRYQSARGWLMHVPGLAIEVWSEKDHLYHGYPDRYVIVFRGTDEGGGMYSNMRFIAKIFALAFDQYKQARDSVNLVVSQINARLALARLKACHGEIKGCAVMAPTPTITTVGHSLGAALASYALYEHKMVSAVHGFNPSRFDGSDFLRTDKEKLAERWAQAKSDPDLFFVTEDGEVLDRLFSCVPGRLFGESGGPMIGCDRVTLSNGTSFQKHSINPLACNLGKIARSMRLKASSHASEDIAGHYQP